MRPNKKKIPVFRVTGPYLNLLVKPRIFFRFSGKNIILCILKGKIAFSKIIKLYFFSRKKLLKKIYVCLPYLKFSDPLLETHLLFYLAWYWKSIIHQAKIHIQSTLYTSNSKGHGKMCWVIRFKNLFSIVQDFGTFEISPMYMLYGKKLHVYVYMYMYRKKLQVYVYMYGKKLYKFIILIYFLYIRNHNLKIHPNNWRSQGLDLEKMAIHSAMPGFHYTLHSPLV